VVLRWNGRVHSPGPHVLRYWRLRIEYEYQPWKIW
jgi:hypothetical protein